VVVVCLGLLVFLILPGLRSVERGATTPDTTAVAGTEAMSALLRLQGVEGETAFLLLQVAKEGLIVALPAHTLVQGEEGLRPLHMLLAESGFGSAAAALDKLLGIAPEILISADTQVIEDTLEAVGRPLTGVTSPGAAETGGAAEETVESGGEPTMAAARGALVLGEALVAAVGDPQAERTVKSMMVEGQVEALLPILVALKAGGYAAGELPGAHVRGVEFEYYEPDLAAVAAVLGRPAAAVGVTVEVQNGSGLIGAAEEVSALLAPLGFRLLPVRNAEQFPNVEHTQLLTAPDVAAQAGRIRDLLERGTVVQRDDLPGGRIVVIVGKDVVSNGSPPS